MNGTSAYLYPVRPWEIAETEFSISNNYRNESIMALGNGYLGSRGTFEEAYRFDVHTGLEGNFINGFYESEKIRYGELGYGYPEKSQTMLNVPNAKRILVSADGEEFDMLKGRLLSYERKLDLKNAVLTRRLVWESPSGKCLRIEIRRLISFLRRHLMAIEYRVTAENFSGVLHFSSAIEANVCNHTRETNPLIDYGPYGKALETEVCAAENRYCTVRQRVKNNRFALLCSTATGVVSGKADSVEAKIREDLPSTEIEASVQRGETVSLEKFITYYTSLDTDEKELEQAAQRDLARAQQDGFSQILSEQGQYMKSFWNIADIAIQGDDAMQQGIRFNLFHLLQGAPPDDRAGMPAKCLTGEGYEGHYFWDTEMYMINPFICTFPKVARNLLDYRYNTLDAARERARQMGHKKGALYPWRTINGKEASAYYPQGTAQYHIDADIAYALDFYLKMTGDTEFLVEKGAEILVETARLWYDLGAFVDLRDGQFCISDVTGPDEYTSVVDNNFYTNRMAAYNMIIARQAVETLKAEYPDQYQALKKKISLEDCEPEGWKKAADRMYYPYDEKLKIYGQDDTFLYKKPVDKDSIPKEDLPLLLHFHPLAVYRTRLAKQADLLYAMLLLGDQFTLEEKRRHFDFYESVTLHDSSLSPCIFSMFACDIGYYDRALAYFNRTSRLDLDDYQHNVYAGIHAANMAGTWMSIIMGFAGMRVLNGELHFKPWMPKEWKSYQFQILFRGRTLSVSVTAGAVRLTLLKGKELPVFIDGRAVPLCEGETSCEKI